MEAIIVPCTKEKIWDGQIAPEQVAAKDAYTKPRFKEWKKYAERSGRPWFILSTKYGLIKPDTLIEKYGRIVSDACRDDEFKKRLRAQGKEHGLENFDKVVLLDWEKFAPLVQAAIGDQNVQYELKKLCY